MSGVNWHRSCRGVESGAHSLWIVTSRRHLFRRQMSYIRCQEQKCDLEIYTEVPRFPRVKNRGESIRLFIVCSWPGRQLKKRRWLRVAVRVVLIAGSITVLVAIVALFFALSSGIT